MVQGDGKILQIAAILFLYKIGLKQSDLHVKAFNKNSEWKLQLMTSKLCQAA